MKKLILVLIIFFSKHAFSEEKLIGKQLLCYGDIIKGEILGFSFGESNNVLIIWSDFDNGLLRQSGKYKANVNQIIIGDAFIFAKEKYQSSEDIFFKIDRKSLTVWKTNRFLAYATEKDCTIFLKDSNFLAKSIIERFKILEKQKGKKNKI